VRYGVDLFRSDDLLGYLTSRVLNPEFQVRFKWRPNSIAMWDNLLTQHYAVMDYEAPRKMARATLKGQPISN
jgi:taurine dioxygenase